MYEGIMIHKVKFRYVREFDSYTKTWETGDTKVKIWENLSSIFYDANDIDFLNQCPSKQVSKEVLQDRINEGKKYLPELTNDEFIATLWKEGLTNLGVTINALLKSGTPRQRTLFNRILNEIATR